MYENKMPHQTGSMRECHPSGTSGIDRVPRLVHEFSMIGVSNKRSAGPVLPPPSGVQNEDKDKSLSEGKVPSQTVRGISIQGLLMRA
jgi:hypothetical protein